MATKLTTVIVNQTKHGLIIKVGTHRQLARLASFKAGGEYKMLVDLNWTYQEFVLEGCADATMKLSVNSDDCCDYQRITVTEADGKLDALREPRQQSVDTNSHAVVEAAATTSRRPALNIIHNLLPNSSWKIW